MKVSAPFSMTHTRAKMQIAASGHTDARRCKDTFFENYTKNTGNAWIVRL